MIEAEWLATANDVRMLEIAHAKLLRRGDAWWGRRMRLVAAGCFRLAWSEIPDEVLREAVVIAERYADGDCGRQAMQDAQSNIVGQSHWLKSRFVDACLRLLHQRTRLAFDSYQYAFDWTAEGFPRVEGERRGSQGKCDVVLDTLGNPFRPVAFSPSWRTDTATAIARQMYDSRDFSAMPILADTLQDAGCDIADILAHCRDVNQVHVRGCL